MTNLVHARRQLSCHVTMAEAMKMIVERDDADIRCVILSHFYNISGREKPEKHLQSTAFTRLYTRAN